MKVVATTIKKEVVKKKTLVVESYNSYNNEVSLPPSKEFYIVLEVAPKNDQRLVCFVKAKWKVLNLTKSLSISMFFLFEYIS
jgi:hypothetical protein